MNGEAKKKRRNQKTVKNSPEFAEIQEHLILPTSGLTAAAGGGGELLRLADGISLPFSPPPLLPRFI